MFNQRLLFSFIVLIFSAFGCITIKTQYSSSSSTGLGTNQKSSKAILKNVRDKTYAGIFGKILFKDAEQGLNGGNRKKMQDELNRIGGLIYQVGNRNWQTSTFGVAKILVPKLDATVVDKTEENARTLCNDATKKYNVEFSVGLIRKLYLNSVERALALQREQTRELGSIANFKIKTTAQYLDALLNLKGVKAGIFTGFSDEKFDKFSEGMDAALELQRISNYVTIEFFKALLFIMSHENYHAISNCEISKEAETYADIFAAIIYQLTVRDNSNNQDAILRFFFGEKYNSQNLPTVLEFISGRSIQNIIKNMYEHTEFEKGTAIHMPLQERLNFMDTNLDLSNVENVYSVIGNKILFDYSNNK